jgi:MscS family membrane protein
MEFIESTFSYINPYIIQLLFTVGLLFLYIISRKVAASLVRKQMTKHTFIEDRELYIKKLINILLTLALILLVGAVWEISAKGLSVYFVSIFTVVGVGLFANWSMLSNITASIIIFFFYPYKVGESIKIIDGENSVEGTVMDITLFNIEIKTAEGRTVTYPNNLAIQKPMSDA